LAVPPEQPWLGAMLAELPRHVLVPRPQVEPTHAFAALWLRLELISAVWLAAEVCGRRGDAPARLARTIAVVLPLGLAMALWDFWNGIDIRGDYFLGRLKQGLPRNNRPLIDNNALGTVLVVALPPLIAAIAARLWRRPRRTVEAVLLGAGLVVGAYLLFSTRSKAALGAFALSLPLLLLLRLGVRRVLLRPLLGSLVGLGLLAAVVAQLLPEATVHRIASTRYGSDLIRVVRLDIATHYLQQNRVGPWVAARNAGLDAPVTGQGLGAVPRVFADYRDPELATLFNPLSENAHNQFLQVFAEEGLVGSLLFVGLFAAGALGVLRALRACRGVDSERAWLLAGLAAGLGALTVNLQVGHSLLESSGALWGGALLGICLGCGAAAAPQCSPRVGRGPALAALAFALGLGGVWLQPRAELEDASYGAYPWVERAQLGPGADRLLSTDARYFVRWGAGERMFLWVLDPRPFLFAERLRVTIDLDGQTVLDGFELSRPPDGLVDLESDLVKLDPPAGVREGDLIELRIRTAPVFSETFYGASGRDWIGPRVSAPIYRHRR
ncbi:MAG: O-antigen ligase family protein, partial [Planctomycetota bacterium]